MDAVVDLSADDCKSINALYPMDAACFALAGQKMQILLKTQRRNQLFVDEKK